jgi:PhnB protein
MSKVSPVPQGHHTAAPYLVVDDANGAIAFYSRAFGAKELFRMPGPGGKLMHAEILIGDSPIMLCDENPEQGARSPKAFSGSPVSVFLYVPDVDALFKKAVAAGATTVVPVTDMFWGDRFAQLVDPYGHSWQIATHVEDVSPAEMEQRMAKMA